MTMVLTAWRRIRVMPLGCLPGAEPTWIDPSGVHAECAGQLLATRLSTTGTMFGLRQRSLDRRAGDGG